MKKTLAIILALALVFSSFTVAFAEETLPVDAQSAKTLGMIVGGGNGVTLDYLKTTPDRTQAAAMFLRLKGLYDTAMAFTGTDNFADANQSTWAKPMMAYLKANPQLGFEGVGNNNFNPTGKMDAKSYYKVMLTALGYKQTVGTTVVGDFTWENLTTFAAGVNLKAVAGVTNFTVSDLATATIETLKTNAKGATKTLAASLVEAKVITEANAIAAGVVPAIPVLAVDSFVAKTASSFVVKFNTAVADTTKATISVKRNSVAVALTTGWNEAKTEATLTFAGILPEGDYAATVTVDGKDLGSKTAAITKQKIAKIEVLGDQLSVAPPTTAGGVTTPGNGYATYKVYDQYGVDITSTPMSNSGINFNTSVGTAAGRNGLITITSFNTTTFITQFPTATVTAYCTDSAVSVTKSLTVSLSQGTLGDITLNKVVNADNKEIKSNDTISKFYIDYTALDINGNATKSATLVNNGLIFTPGTTELMTSYPNLLKARVVADPNVTGKSVIELVVMNGTIYQDTQVIITAMTKTGKASSITIDVKKPAVLDRLNIMAPAVLVAEGDQNVEIPYEAFDQHGNVLTAYSDIVYPGSLTSVTGLVFDKTADGKLKITTGTHNFVDKVPAYFQVVTSTGKQSMITIRPDALAYANDLVIDSSVVTQYMQKLATQSMDFGAYYGGFKVVDQFGRTMNLTNAVNDAYYVTASVPAGSTIISITAPNKAYMGNRIKLTASNFGTETVTFKLIKKSDLSEVATKYVTFAVIEDKDIVGLSIDEIPTMYATAGVTTGIASQDTAQVKDWNQGPSYYGKLSNGGLVTLNSTTDGNVNLFTDDSSKFIIDAGYVRALALPTGVTEATGTLTATVALNGTSYVASTPLKSTKATPVASAVSVSVTSASSQVDTGSALTGYTISGDVVSVDLANIATLTGQSMFRHNANGLTRAKVYFRAKDQYGKYAMTIPYLSVVDQGATNVATYSVNATTGQLVVAGTATAGDTFTITAVSNNGLSKTVKFVVK
jgi:hypothetical protein